MLSLKTMSNWLSYDRKPKVSQHVKAPFPSPVTTQQVSTGEHNPLWQTDQRSLVEARVAKFGDGSGYRLEQTRRQFLWTASGIAAAFLGINRVYERVFEIHNPQAVAPGQLVLDDTPLDLTRFAAEHWNPLMLEELYFKQERFK
jgi:hypothetical protein